MKSSQHLVAGVLNEISLWMTQAGTSDEKITNVQIVLVEALNNIIEHGSDCEGSSLIDIEITVSNNIIVAQLRDSGIKFTPPEIMQSPLQYNDDLNDFPEGGFGWFLIRKITSSVEFTRTAGKNHLVLKFQG